MLSRFMTAGLAAALCMTTTLMATGAATEASAATAEDCRGEAETLRMWMRGSFAPLPPEEQLRIDDQIARTIATCDSAIETSNRAPTVLMDRAYAAIAMAKHADAAGYMREAAEAGHPPAMVTWAQFRGHGNYVEKNAEEAWFMLLQALKTDHVGARMQAAMEFLPGGAGPENVERVHEVFAKLIEEGATEAMVTYAFRVLRMAEPTTPKEDVERGAALVKRAAEAGDGPAMISMALLHVQGYGVERDLAEAKAWATKALEAGNTRAYGTLAQISEAEGDTEKALEWFGKGTAAGDPFSQTMMGFQLSAGMLVDQDLDRAVELWTEARWKGSRLAASYLRVHREQQEREAAMEKKQQQAPKSD